MFGYVAVAIVVGLIVRAVLLDRARTREIRDYAQGAGRIYIGEALPSSFPLGATSLHGISHIKNVVAGDRNGREFVFFDCTLGSGKGSRSQTVVGVRGSSEFWWAQRFDRSLSVETACDWTVVNPNRLLSVRDVEAILLDA